MDSNLAYQDGWKDPLRKELLGGRVVLMAPASINHTFVSGNIYFLFAKYLKGKSCTPISDGCTVFLTDEDHFVPDVMVVCDRDKIKWDGVHGAPDLVVEVLSPGTARNDRTHKKAVYEACGVREYWLVDPSNRTIEQHLLRDGKLVLHTVYVSYTDRVLESMTEEERAAVETHFKCSLYDDLDIALDDIFSGLLP